MAKVYRRKKKGNGGTGSEVTRTGSKSSYYRPDMDAVKKQAAALRKRSRSIWTPKEGKNIVRIMPPYDEAGEWFYEMAFHYNCTPEGYGIPCRQVLVKEKCAPHERMQKLSLSKRSKERKLAADMDVVFREYMNILDRKDEDAGIQVYDATEGILSKLLSFFSDPDWGDFTHPEDGFDIIIIREGMGQGTRYPEVRLKRNPSPIGYPGWKSELKNLRAFRPVPTYDEQLKMMSGATSWGSSDDDDD